MTQKGWQKVIWKLFKIPKKTGIALLTSNKIKVHGEKKS